MNKNTEEISSVLGKHYSKKFNKYGPTEINTAISGGHETSAA